MKRVKLLFVLVLTCVFLTGCFNSEKKLTCTKSETDSGMKSDETITMKFKSDKATSVEMKQEITAVDADVKSSWSTMADMYDAIFGAFKDESIEGFTITTNNDKANYKYTFTMKLDLEKLTKEKLEELDMDDADYSKPMSEVKKSAEEDGYKCK